MVIKVYYASKAQDINGSDVLSRERSTRVNHMSTHLHAGMTVVEQMSAVNTVNTLRKEEQTICYTRLLKRMKLRILNLSSAGVLVLLYVAAESHQM